MSLRQSKVGSDPAFTLWLIYLLPPIKYVFEVWRGKIKIALLPGPYVFNVQS